MRCKLRPARYRRNRTAARRGPAAGRSVRIPGATSRRYILVGAGAIEILLLATAAWWPGAAAPLPLLPLWGSAFLVYLVAAGAVGAPGDGRGERVVIWGVAILLRLALLPLLPELTDDFHRYLWDGHVQRAGINPYLYAPADAALDGIDAPGRSLVNNPGVPTIYPPLSQLTFLLVAWTGGGIMAMKLLWTLLELGAGWGLAHVASRSGRPVGRVLVLFLWSPLLVVETAWNGHVDALGLAALTLVLLARKPGAKGAALGLATAAKLAPAAALPPLLRKGGWRAGIAFAGVVGLLYLPYLDAGGGLFTGLTTYARHWHFMAGPFLVLEGLLSGDSPPRAVAGGLVLGVVAWTTYRGFDIERALFWILGVGLLLTPTLHPWYVLWILPLAALRASPPWILLTGLAPLGYWGLGAFLRTGTWPQPAALRWLLWLPVVLLLVREGVRARREGATTRPSERRSAPDGGGEGHPARPSPR